MISPLVAAGRLKTHDAFPGSLNKWLDSPATPRTRVGANELRGITPGASRGQRSMRYGQKFDFACRPREC